MGRVRQAYRMDGQEADVLIAALAPQKGIEVYELWHEAVRFVAVEENNKKSIYDEVDEPYFPDTSDMGNGPLEGRILTKRLAALTVLCKVRNPTRTFTESLRPGFALHL